MFVATSAPGKFPVGAILCSPHSVAELLEEIGLLLKDKARSPRTILCVNSHIYNLACQDEHLRAVLNQARITAADGMAIVWAGRLLGGHFRERCNMTEAYHAFLRSPFLPPTKAILIGCSEEEARHAAETANQNSRHCRIVKSYSGFLNESEYERIFSEQSEIELIFLGMGTPRTELIAALAAKVCPSAVIWGIGGGTIRIEAGTLKEAPVFWRRLGIQWFYRLLKEPHALWSRYLIGNPLFVLRIFRAALARRKGRRKE